MKKVVLLCLVALSLTFFSCSPEEEVIYIELPDSHGDTNGNTNGNTNTDDPIRIQGNASFNFETKELNMIVILNELDTNPDKMSITLHDINGQQIAANYFYFQEQGSSGVWTTNENTYVLFNSFNGDSIIIKSYTQTNNSGNHILLAQSDPIPLN